MSSTMLNHHYKRFSPRFNTGFSLVELMVSITIGLLLLLGLVTLLVNSSATHTELQKSSAQIENGRYAMQLLSEDISLAGYYAEYSPTGYTAPEKPCDGAVTPTAPNMPGPIGYDIATSVFPADFACLSNIVSGTGVLVLRRVQTLKTTPTAAAAGAAAAVYLQVSQCNTDANTTPFKFGTVVSTGGFTLRKSDCNSANPADLRKFVSHIYYISSCNDCATNDNNNPIPTLKEVEYVDGAAQTPVALVEGIEDMQFDYGIDQTADGEPDCIISNPSNTNESVNPLSAEIASGNCLKSASSPAYIWTDAAANWANVMAVRVNLMARNIQATAGYNDNKTYALGLAKPTYTVPSGSAKTYKRHLYTALIRLENPSGRREAP